MRDRGVPYSYERFLLGGLGGKRFTSHERLKELHYNSQGVLGPMGRLIFP